MFAFGFFLMIGFECGWWYKLVGLRMHTFVGLGVVLLVFVSKYGFNDVLCFGVMLDFLCVAVQIVFGIGFIGGGLIFVCGDVVCGLMTVLVVWIIVAIGMVCGVGFVLLVIIVTVGHFVVVFVYLWFIVMFLVL